MKTIKQLEKDFKELHLKCVEETQELGRASYVTHGKRCEALAGLEQTESIKKMIEENIRVVKIAQTCKGVDMGKTDAQIHILKFILSEVKGEEK